MLNQQYTHYCTMYRCCTSYMNSGFGNGDRSVVYLTHRVDAADPKAVVCREPRYIGLYGAAVRHACHYGTGFCGGLPMRGCSQQPFGWVVVLRRLKSEVKVARIKAGGTAPFKTFRQTSVKGKKGSCIRIEKDTNAFAGCPAATGLRSLQMSAWTLTQGGRSWTRALRQLPSPWLLDGK